MLTSNPLHLCSYQGGRSYKSFLEFLQQQLENDKVGRLWANAIDGLVACVFQSIAVQLHICISVMPVSFCHEVLFCSKAGCGIHTLCQCIYMILTGLCALRIF